MYKKMLPMKWKIVVCIFFFAQMLAASSGQGARHRHRHRYYQQRNMNEVDLLNADQSYAEQILLEFEEDLNTLRDGLTIKEDVREMGGNSVTFPNGPELRATVRSPVHSLITEVTANSTTHQRLEIQVRDSILRMLSFYHSQLDEITTTDTALSLQILKDVDDKHGSFFQRNYPLSQWIQSACAARKDDSEEKFCMSMNRQWKNRSGGRTMDYWKPETVLQNHLNQIDDVTMDNIGNEKEGLWGRVNGECQEAVVNRCEIPYICERTLMDPTPRSQYLLTHQIFQRLLVDNANCPNLRPFVSDDHMYAKMCTKAYLEAQYLDLLDVPINNRDLFAELVGFCGYLGHTSFLREDWLQRILSWQSESDSGCFIEDPLTPVGLLTTDMGFKRKATVSELREGIEQPNEKCLPHLSAVALTALTAYYDYLMDLKSHGI